MFKILTLSILLLSIPSFGASDQIRTVKITKLSTYDGYTTVYFWPQFSNTQGCSNTNKTKAVIRFENDVRKEMYASLLAAAMAKKTVDLGIQGCDASGIPAIYRVDITL